MEEPNRDELLALMKEYSLSPADISLHTEYSISTVNAWLMPARDSARARPVPNRALSLLKAKIEAAKANLKH